MLVLSGDQLILDQDTVLESNGECGLNVLPAAGQVVRQVILDKVWTENNWASLTGDPTTRATKYAIRAGDGDPVLYAVELRSCTHNETCRVASLNNVVDAVIESPRRVTPLAQDYELLSSTVVHLSNWPAALPLTPAYLGKATTAAMYHEGAIVTEFAIGAGDWGSLAAGARATATFTITEGGAVGTLLGYSVEPSLSIAQGGLEISASVATATTVDVVRHNPTGGAIDPGACTLRLRLRR
jgi:hypothetical protein